MKEKLFILPRYIASLKYFEKLIPPLSQHYEVAVALLADDGMRAYCRERNIATTEALLPEKRGMRIPFISHMLDEEHFLQRARGFLELEKPAVLLTETAIPQRVRILFEMATGRGVRTVALQWCQASKSTRGVRLSLRNKVRRAVARHGGFARALLRETYFVLLRLTFAIANAATGNRYRRTNLFVDALGVIEERATDVFAERGFDRRIMQVVGFADADAIRVLKEKLAGDAAFRKRLRDKYGLHPGMKTILVVPTMFHAGGATVSMTPHGQLDYYRRIITDVRTVYPPRKARILFKLHPRDSAALYAPLEADGIRLIGNEGDMEELVLISDLVIAHPLTAANFTLVIAGAPAIFVNFSSVSYLDEGKELYRLREIIKTPERFLEALHLFKKGALPPQYEPSDIPADSLSRIVELVSGSSGS